MTLSDAPEYPRVVECPRCGTDVEVEKMGAMPRCGACNRIVTVGPSGGVL